MNEYDLRKLIISSPSLDANEKVLLFALCFRLDWKTWSGPVSVSNLAELTSSTERTIRRVLSKLKEKGVIERVSTREKGAAKSRVALTKINLSFFPKYDKVDTVKVDTDRIDTDRVDTVNIDMDKGDKVDMVKGDDIDPHTISNNNKQYSFNSMVTSKWGNERGGDDFTEEPKEEEREVKKVYKFRYHSSITDPEERKRVEDYVIKNSHRLRHIERERLLFPDLTKPLI